MKSRRIFGARNQVTYVTLACSLTTRHWMPEEWLEPRALVTGSNRGVLVK
jgi:hypothetical protein